MNKYSSSHRIYKGLYHHKNHNKNNKTVSTINTVLLGRFVNIQEVVTAVTKYSFGENFDHGFTVDIAYQQK